MNKWRNIFVLIYVVSGLAYAEPPPKKNPIPWGNVEKFDFCPHAKTFDFRNAYWLAALSYYAYWYPDQYDRVFSTKFGQNIKVKFPPDPNEHATEMPTYGMGWSGRVNFFTSTKVLPKAPSSPKDNYTSYYSAPLPFEACVKKEKLWCFGSPNRSPLTPDEKKECGEQLEDALMSFERLQNITLLNSGGELNADEVVVASKDQARIEDIVKIYEQKKKVNLGLDFKDRHFAERCEVYRVTDDLTPDTQAIWMENSEMVVISIRGTESKNIIDWTTDLATSFQLNHEYLPFWKRNVHQGFEKSLDVMTDWLNDQINQLFNNYPNAQNIPVFVTGHSMGGALAVLVMTELLERNLKVSTGTRLNLKALYTYGAPRIGNDHFARYFLDLNRKDQVGFYRIVNKRDFITKAPCWDYTHFGTHIQINPVGENQDSADENTVDISVNPNPEDHNYCAYGSALFDSLFNAQEYTNDHLLDSYFKSLARSRRALLTVFENERRTRRDPAPYEFPKNCEAPADLIFRSPEYLKFNYKDLPIEIEN